jgi:hemerythrin-like domain-containing protein
MPTKDLLSSRRRRIALAAVLVTAATVASGLVTRAARRRSREPGEASRAADVGFMVAMHNAFRRDLALLEHLTREAGATATMGQELRGTWESFRDRLHRHHAAEDDDLWPVLRERLSAPSDLARVDGMVEEHGGLSEALDAVDRAMSASPSADGGPDLAAAVDRLGRLVQDHLEHEERDVLPLVEEHLTRADWRAFLVTERRRTPRRARPDFLGWVLDGANATDTRAVLAELPPPGRLAYRYVIGPRYRSREGHRTGAALAG